MSKKEIIKEIKKLAKDKQGKFLYSKIYITIHVERTKYWGKTKTTIDTYYENWVFNSRKAVIKFLKPYNNKLESHDIDTCFRRVEWKNKIISFQID